MDYNSIVNEVFKHFKENNTGVISTKQLYKTIDENDKKKSRKNIKQMVEDKFLSIGPSFYIRNDKYYRQQYGYKVYINCLKKPINLNDWLDYLKKNKEFSFLGFAELNSPLGEYIKIESKGLAEWSGNTEERNILFDYEDYKIIVRNPDSTTLKKMYKVSKEFDAKVQGEDGEFYDKDGFHY
ncbi:MAG: hypothetical protein GY714_00570 [Desulfobacterales bacterium]|nr:hypothetical protein [Desulfobacterales bacterium]